MVKTSLSAKSETSLATKSQIARPRSHDQNTEQTELALLSTDLARSLAGYKCFSLSGQPEHRSSMTFRDFLNDTNAEANQTRLAGWLQRARVKLFFPLKKHKSGCLCNEMENLNR